MQQNIKATLILKRCQTSHPPPNPSSSSCHAPFPLPPSHSLASFTLTGQNALIRSHLSVQTCRGRRGVWWWWEGSAGANQNPPPPPRPPLRNTCQHAPRQPRLDEASGDGRRCDAGLHASLYKASPGAGNASLSRSQSPVGGALFSRAQRFTTDWLVFTGEKKQEVSW